MTTTDAIHDENIAAIVSRPYRKVIHGDAAGGFLGEVPELPGCITAGETETETLINLRDAMEAWVQSALLDGVPIPEPHESSSPVGGTLLMGLPDDLYQQLLKRAASEQVSASALAIKLIAQGLGVPITQDNI